jgi:two-component system OmpR family response regulator
MKLLLAEDDQKISKFLNDGLTQDGYFVDTAFDGEMAQNLLILNRYDLVICDIMLPKIDGLSVLETFRKVDQKTPVLILSAKRSVDDRVLGLQKGGDDYLTKPFSLAELIARVQALLRRTTALAAPPAVAASTLLKGGELTIDLLTREVKRDGRNIELQAKEFAMLEYFLRNQGHPLNKLQILEKIWNYKYDPQTNVVDVLVFRLRAKVDRDFEKKYIQSVRGVGYVFQAD